MHRTVPLRLDTSTRADETLTKQSQKTSVPERGPMSSTLKWTTLLLVCQGPGASNRSLLSTSTPLSDQTLLGVRVTFQNI